MDNRAIADRLTQYAHRLVREGGSLYRVRAYRRAAETVLGLDRSLEEIVAEGGRRRLRQLPGIGSHLAVTLDQLVRTGEFHTFKEVAETGSTSRESKRAEPLGCARGS